MWPLQEEKHPAVCGVLVHHVPSMDVLVPSRPDKAGENMTSGGLACTGGQGYLSLDEVQRKGANMFTGIVTDIGVVTSLEQEGDLRARIQTGYDTQGIDMGASIASDGVCLTVVDLGADWYDVQISAETVTMTNLSDWVLAPGKFGARVESGR